MSQQNYIDSLVNVSLSATTDSLSRCRVSLQLSSYFQTKDSLRSAMYKRKATGILSHLSTEKKILEASLIFAKHYLNERSYDEAMFYSLKALNLAKKAGVEKDIVGSYFYIGSIYLSKGDRQKALDYFMPAYKLAHKLNDKELMAHLNSSFGAVYLQQSQFDSAVVYFRRSLDHFETIPADDEYTMINLQNIGSALIGKGSFDEGQPFLRRALELAKKRHDKNAETTILFNISNGYQRSGDFTKAESYTIELIKEAEKYGFKLLEVYGKVLLANIKKDQKVYDAAILQSKEALALVYKEHFTSLIPTLYDILVACYENKQDYKEALKYKNLSVQFNDSLSSIENASYIEEIKHKYNLQQKNQELALKTELLHETETSDRQKTVIIVSLLVVCFSGLLSAFFYNQRRKIKEELIKKTIFSENQNKHFEAFINGQEQERKRIASDLHDGLAQNLVMLRMGISNLEMPDPEQQDKLIHYSNEIDRMIEETRKISHNMMPDVLVDLGLEKALKSLINEINSNHPSLHIQLLVTEPFKTPVSRIEIQLYRVIQELLNNILKHAEASSCEIILSSTDTEVKAMVKDNGKGFDVNSKKKGIGLQNIYSRVNSLNGVVDIKTELNKGTVVNLTIPTTL